MGPSTRRGNVAAYASGGVLVVLCLAALLAPWIAPHDPISTDLSSRLLPPSWTSGGDSSHLLGTDAVGRDILSRIIFGLRYSLSIGLFAVMIGGLVGVAAGLLAGFFDGTIASFIFGRLADVQQAIPFLILTLAVIASLGPSFRNLILILGLGAWLFYYRVVRGEVLAIRSQAFIDSSHAIGASNFRIILRHVLPNIVPSVIVVATFYTPRLIMFAAALSFLGLGVQIPTPELGAMISEGRNVIQQAWWVTVLPGIALAIIVLALNTLGDWMRDRLDPMLRSSNMNEKQP